MAKPRHLGVAVVLGVAAALLTVSATSNRGPTASSLADLIDEQSARNQQAQAVQDAASARLAELLAADVTVPKPDELLLADAGTLPVTGPGVTVTLWDADPAAVIPAGITPDDLLVHQQDLSSVINALWAGGAEALSLQDQRVISTTSYRCVGNVLLINGQHFSPPYVIQAIGDPPALMAALAADPAVRIYLQYVEVVGLGYSATTATDLTLPAAQGRVQFAEAAEE